MKAGTRLPDTRRSTDSQKFDVLLWMKELPDKLPTVKSTTRQARKKFGNKISENCVRQCAEKLGKEFRPPRRSSGRVRDDRTYADRVKRLSKVVNELVEVIHGNFPDILTL